MGAPTQTLERGANRLSRNADRASRVAIAHAEGLPHALVRLYSDLGIPVAFTHSRCITHIFEKHRNHGSRLQRGYERSEWDFIIKVARWRRKSLGLPLLDF